MAVTHHTKFERRLLSGSTNGRPIKVAATATPGTTLHTATSVAGEFDEVTIYAVNSGSAAEKLTIEFGGTTSPDDLIEVTIAPEDGLVLIIPGVPLTGGSVVRAFSAAGNLINVVGQVTRIGTS